MRILLIGHGSSANHGCEAIIRTITHMLKEQKSKNQIVVCTSDIEAEKQNPIPKINQFIKYSSCKRWSPSWIVYQSMMRIFKQYDYAFKIHFKELLKEIEKSDVVISVGGDNYCYGNQSWLYFFDKYAAEKSKKLIFWGCSIEPTVIDEAMIEDLKRFAVIFPRESITHNALKHKGIITSNYLFPDPAFTMEAQAMTLPDNWQPGNVLGCNISPLISNYSQNGETLENIYEKFLLYVLDTTDMNIALIPHVTDAKSDDYTLLKRLYHKINRPKRMILFNDQLTAPQIKWYISQCRIFIGARTHSTIAAYSTCVPTLVIGYSVKAKGIARDIFGSEEHMVIPVQSLNHEDDLVTAFTYIQENEEKIRKHLEDFMPEYIGKAWLAGEEVKKII